MGSLHQAASVSNWREVEGGSLVPLTDVGIQPNPWTQGADVVLSNIDLDDQMVVRWFVADVTFEKEARV